METLLISIPPWLAIVVDSECMTAPTKFQSPSIDLFWLLLLLLLFPVPPGGIGPPLWAVSCSKLTSFPHETMKSTNNRRMNDPVLILYSFTNCNTDNLRNPIRQQSDFTVQFSIATVPQTETEAHSIKVEHC